VRRQTSVEIAARWRGEARARLHDGGDCRVVFCFGTNDATVEHGARRVAPDVSVATLQRVLGEAAELGLPAFVVGPPPAGEHAQDERICVLSRRFDAVCRDRDVPFAAVVEALLGTRAWVGEAAAGDGSHPAAGGYDALARLVLQAGWLDWVRWAGVPRGS
jgi:lysophospholipase L1-like esterase